MEFPASNNRSPLEILVSTAFAGRQLNTGLRVPGSISKCLKHHPQNLFPSLSLPCRSTCALRCHFRDMAPESPMRCRSKICCCKGIIYDSPPPPPNVRSMIRCIYSIRPQSVRWFFSPKQLQSTNHPTIHTTWRVFGHKIVIEPPSWRTS